jgi:hypothetical protein
MISTSTVLSTTVGCGVNATSFAQLSKLNKTPSIFSNNVGADNFLPSLQMAILTTEDFTEASVGQGEILEPIKTPSVFANSKGSDSFVPGGQMAILTVEGRTGLNAGPGEFNNQQTGSVFNTLAAPTFIVPKSDQVPPSFMDYPLGTWYIEAGVPMVKMATKFITQGPMYDAPTFFLDNVYLPITVSEVNMSSLANTVSTQAIRQYWS